MGGNGHWPQRPGQSQSVNLEQLTHQHSLKSGGWPGFEPGRASSCPVPGAAVSSVLGRTVEMSFCTRTGGSWSVFGVEVMTEFDLMMVEDRLTYRLSDIL